jgi:cell division protein FtsX
MKRKFLTIILGKMMAAMGFGALALLAMKALMVSALALMLSLIIAAKKLAGGKEEDSHHVVYAQEVGSSHHRRRRSPDNIFDDLKNHPYRGYMIIPTEIQKLRS